MIDLPATGDPLIWGACMLVGVLAVATAALGLALGAKGGRLASLAAGLSGLVASGGVVCYLLEVDPAIARGMILAGCALGLLLAILAFIQSCVGKSSPFVAVVNGVLALAMLGLGAATLLVSANPHVGQMYAMEKELESTPDEGGTVVDMPSLYMKATVPRGWGRIQPEILGLEEANLCLMRNNPAMFLVVVGLDTRDMAEGDVETMLQHPQQGLPESQELSTNETKLDDIPGWRVVTEAKVPESPTKFHYDNWCTSWEGQLVHIMAWTAKPFADELTAPVDGFLNSVRFDNQVRYELGMLERPPERGEAALHAIGLTCVPPGEEWVAVKPKFIPKGLDLAFSYVKFLDGGGYSLGPRVGIGVHPVPPGVTAEAVAVEFGRDRYLRERPNQTTKPRVLFGMEGIEIQIKDSLNRSFYWMGKYGDHIVDIAIEGRRERIEELLAQSPGFLRPLEAQELPELSRFGNVRTDHAISQYVRSVGQLTLGDEERLAQHLCPLPRYHEAEADIVEIAPVGWRWLAVRLATNQIQIFDQQTRQWGQVISPEAGGTCLAGSLQSLFVMREDQVLERWDVPSATRTHHRSLSGQVLAMAAGQAVEDRLWLVVREADGVVLRCLDGRDLSPVELKQDGLAEVPAEGIALNASPNGRAVAIASKTYTLYGREMGGTLKAMVLTPLKFAVPAFDSRWLITNDGIMPIDAAERRSPTKESSHSPVPVSDLVLDHAIGLVRPGEKVEKSLHVTNQIPERLYYSVEYGTLTYQSGPRRLSAHPVPFAELFPGERRTIASLAVLPEETQEVPPEEMEARALPKVPPLPEEDVAAALAAGNLPKPQRIRARGRIQALKVGGNGRYLVIEVDKAPRIWVFDLEDHAWLASFEPAETRKFMWTADANAVYLAGERQIEKRTFADGLKVARSVGFPHQITALQGGYASLPEGALAVESKEKVFAVDPEDFSIRATWKTALVYNVRNPPLLACTPDGAMFAAKTHFRDAKIGLMTVPATPAIEEKSSHPPGVYVMNMSNKQDNFREIAGKTCRYMRFSGDAKRLLLSQHILTLAGESEGPRAGKQVAFGTYGNDWILIHNDGPVSNFRIMDGELKSLLSVRGIPEFAESGSQVEDRCFFLTKQQRLVTLPADRSALLVRRLSPEDVLAAK